MQTVSIINQKGGCGKTTSAISLAGMFAKRGRRTLLVDMDPQSHCAAGLSIPEARIEVDIGDALLAEGRGVDVSKLIWRAARNLDLIPSRTRLAGVEAARGGLAEAANRERRLAGVLAGLKGNYDLALVDCPPSIGLLTFNALAAADCVLIPVETAYFSLQGATKQVATIRSLSKRLERAPAYFLVATMHDEGSAVSRDMLEELRRKFGKRVAPVVVRHDAKLREAASFGQGIAEFASESRGAQDYAALADWLTEVLGVVSGSRPRVPERVAAEGDEAYGAVTVRTPAAGSTGELARRVMAEEVGEKGRVEAPGLETAQGGGVAVAEGPPADPIGRARELAERAKRFAERSAALRTREAGKVEERREAKAMPSHLLGVRWTRRGLLFVQPLSAAQEMAVAGDFNGWSPEAGRMKRNEELGVFEACLAAGPGRHSYRLYVDGRWMTDPYNARTEPNPFGESNSVVEVE